jgi:N-acetylmuramoyl-L-alanine amidase
MKFHIVKIRINHRKLLTVGLPVFLTVCVLILAVALSFGKLQSVMVPDQSGDGGYQVILIDPGHGGVDGGAVGYDGVVEKTINLKISIKLKSLFEFSGFKVLMTREDDRSVHDAGSTTIRQKKVTDIHNRSKLLAKHPEALFISIHQNKFEQKKYSGTQVFFSKNNEKSRLLAQFIQTNVKDLIQPNNTREIKPAGKNLYILYHATTPAVMVECGFLSNQNEAMLLQNDRYQSKMAFSIYCGLLDYCSGATQDNSDKDSGSNPEKSKTSEVE